MKRRSLLLGTAAVALAGASSARAQPARIAVVATFSILADLVRQVGGERVEVISLIGPDSDAHGFEPSPADAGRLVSARLVVANGLGFEGWIDRLVKASGTKAATLVASRGVKPLADAGHDHGHDHALDPHAFQSVANAKLYVGNIRDALVAADPDGKADYGARATRYLAALDEVEGEVRGMMSRIPAERRRVITDHDAFAYFGAAYGVGFIAPKGVSREGDVSARDVARIVRQIRAEKLRAVFFENISDPRLMERIAKESGARIGGKLYSDALSGPDGPASSYVALMRHNAGTIAGALAD